MLLSPGSFRPKFPLHMVWLSTNQCNARCLHCSSNSAIKTHDELTESETLNLIDQLIETEVIDLAISGGEPLMRPDIYRVISYARNRGLTVGLGSNGWKLTEQQACNLASAGLNRLQISLDGLPSSHDALRDWPGLFNKALISIKIAQDTGLRVHVCCTINRLNANELPEFVNFISGIGIHRINFSRYVPTGRGSDFLDLKDTEWEKVIRACIELRDQYKDNIEVTTHLAQQVLIDNQVKSLPSFIGCQAGIGQGCITANGTVLPCVLLPVSIGNIRYNTLRDIWQNSHIIHNLQNRDNLKGLCGVCNQKNRCGGCRAVAFARQGDYLHTDPRCWLKDIAGEGGVAMSG